MMSMGTSLEAPLVELTRAAQAPSELTSRTLAEAQCDYILDVLRATNGKVGGQDGAAARLGLARTTLIYKMRKLGITWDGSSDRRALNGPDADPSTPSALNSRSMWLTRVECESR